MKYFPIFILLCLPLVFNSCGSSEYTQRESTAVSNSDTDFSRYRNLAEYLRRQPGVKIDGMGDNIDIQIRGVSSFGADLRPLFVVDGIVIGNSYADVNSYINMSDVSSIRVLTDSDASGYGMRGANGIIEITLKK